MVRPIGQPVGAGSEIDRGGHDQFLADRIDRWIRDLGEKLTEVLIKKARTAGEHGECGVIPHGSSGLFGFLDHRKKDDLQLLIVIAEGEKSGR